MLPLMVKTLHEIDPNLGFMVRPPCRCRSDSSQAALIHSFSTWLVGGFAVMALVLSVVGLYGVIAYSVSQRTREIGVRMALGAQRASVYQMVMRQAGWLTLIGVGAGLVCAIGASMLMHKVLFGVAAWDCRLRWPAWPRSSASLRCWRAFCPRGAPAGRGILAMRCEPSEKRTVGKLPPQNLSS